ncbi:MAG: hypothetical protein V2A34_11985 [Lentisphaerota bacterium]
MTDSTRRITFALMALTLGVTASTILAADASLDAAVLSAYVWRGQVINDEMVLQPAFTAESEWGLKLNAWANVDLTDKADVKGEVNEIDLLISYSPKFEGPVSLEVGFAEYAFPKEGNWEVELPDGHAVVAEETRIGEDTDTREVFLTVAAEDVILAPTLLLSYDMDEVKDLYVNLGISHSLPLMDETLSLDLSASVGYAFKDYNKYYFGTDDAAFNDGNVAASLAYTVTPSLSLTGTIQYTAMLDSKIKDGAELKFGEKDIVYGGVSASFAF